MDVEDEKVFGSRLASIAANQDQLAAIAYKNFFQNSEDDKERILEK